MERRARVQPLDPLPIGCGAELVTGANEYGQVEPTGCGAQELSECQRRRGDEAPVTLYCDVYGLQTEGIGADNDRVRLRVICDKAEPAVMILRTGCGDA